MKNLLVLLFTLWAGVVSAQTMGQGGPAANSAAWPVKTIVSGSEIDPRAVTVQNATLAVTGTVSVSGTLTVTDAGAGTAVLANVAGSATSVTCLALNANRLGATIYNDSTADMYVKFGTTASTTSFTVKVFSDGFLTVPFDYTGRIDCIWSSAAGSARVTEVTQ